MARKTGAEGRNDWYRRWISSIADDAAAYMEGEPERDARIDDLRRRFTELHRRLARMEGGRRGRGPRAQVPADRRFVGLDAKTGRENYRERLGGNF